MISTKKQFVCPDSDMQLHIDRVFSGEYSVPIQELDSLKSPRILDLGAHYGAFAVWAKERWPGAKIDCYEPNPESFTVLQANCSFAELHNVAVSRLSGKMFLRKGRNNSGESSLYDLGEQATTGFTVECVSAHNLPYADIIKLDTEGSEYFILHGYSFLRKVKAIMLEWHSPADRYRCGHLLIDAGLKCYSDESWRPNRGIMKFYREAL
jgi:FkbM family methyltransferase